MSFFQIIGEVVVAVILGVALLGLLFEGPDLIRKWLR